MRKIIAFFILIYSVTIAQAQIKLSDKDFNNLITLSELYSHDNMCKGAEFAKSAESLRTPMLSHIIDVMIATGRQDSTILDKRFLYKPGHDELMLWFTIREIHYNRISTTKKPLSDAEVAKKVLAENIDERWLVHNYYYFEHSGISMLFNEANLSRTNINMDSLGLKDETEKGIFFLNMMNNLLRGRLMVLQYMKNNARIIEFVKKMPTFNGKQYFYYTSLNFPDFDWSGYTSKDTYKQMHINDLINTLLIQFTAMVNTSDKSGARELYLNSILHKPEFFQYSKQTSDLQQLYDRSK